MYWQRHRLDWISGAATSQKLGMSILPPSHSSSLPSFLASFVPSFRVPLSLFAFLSTSLPPLSLPFPLSFSLISLLPPFSLSRGPNSLKPARVPGRDRPTNGFGAFWGDVWWRRCWRGLQTTSHKVEQDFGGVGYPEPDFLGVPHESTTPTAAAPLDWIELCGCTKTGTDIIVLSHYSNSVTHFPILLKFSKLSFVIKFQQVWSDTGRPQVAMHRSYHLSWFTVLC